MPNPDRQNHHVAVGLDALVLVACIVVIHIYAGKTQLIIAAHGYADSFGAVPVAGNLAGRQQGGIHSPGGKCSQIVDLAVLAVSEQVEAGAVAIKHIQHIEGQVLAWGQNQRGCCRSWA